MNALDYNRRVAELQRHQPLRGIEDFGTGGVRHDFMVRARKQSLREWVVTVSPGTVNDQMAAITYLRARDPRGWIMPEDHPQIPLMRRLYGDDFTIVDRLLTERPAPYLLLTTPDESGQDVADFRRVPDEARPAFFKSAAMWEKELLVAYVFVTAAPLRVSRAETLNGFPVATRARRFRIHAGPLPNRLQTVQVGGHREIARLFLERTPGAPEADRIHIPQPQATCWNLWTASVQPSLDFGHAFDPTPVPVFGIGGGIGDGIAAGFFGAIDAITAGVLGGIADLLDQAATTEYWSA